MEPERLLAEPVPAERHGTVGLVVQRERPHALAEVERALAPARERANQDLGVGVACELLSLALEVCAQLAIVVELAVVDDRLRSDAQRLVRSLGEVDDVEPRAQELRDSASSDLATDGAGVIRPAPVHELEAARDRVVAARSRPYVSRDATHAPMVRSASAAIRIDRCARECPRLHVRSGRCSG
jgi:hypothetical protein